MTTKQNLVAVYGSLRKTMHNHGYLNFSEYIGSFQSEPAYDMYSISGSYPGLVPGSTSIHMEVYAVTDGVLQTLNRLEGYKSEDNPNNHYNRVMIDTPYGQSYLYLYNGSTSSLVNVESGDWKSFKDNFKSTK